MSAVSKSRELGTGAGRLAVMACTRALLLLLSLSVPALTAPAPALTAPAPALGHTRRGNDFYFGTNDYEKVPGG